MNNTGSSRQPGWFTFFERKPDAKLRLFCFPYGGGGLSAFSDWAASMPPGVELAVMELPGRGQRFSEPLMHDMSVIIERMANEFISYIDKPYVFFCHSLGAFLGFELMQALRRRDVSLPKLFMVAGMRAPQFEVENQLHSLDDDAFLIALDQYNGTPANILANRELMNLYLPIFRADFSLSEKYQYRPSKPFNLPFIFMGGRDDHTVREVESDGWQLHSERPIVQKFFPGDHFFLFNEGKTAVLSTLASSLRQVMADGLLPEWSVSA
ncbi:thioesterase II family protein [Microbulbifer sp. 2304DJ12-6]|uniref:thioesterase II family protein n=1 Tax=Microbulbifer sp. 2304DJ12-6 TaxID=3233340 RepID=UPI0039AEAC1B